MNAEGSTVGKQAKHLFILEKIDYYSKLVDDLDRFLAEIRGAKDAKFEPMNDPDVKTPPRPIPSLAEFLANEGDRLGTINSHFQDLISAIRSELY